MLNGAQEESMEYEIFRNAVVKGYELALETSGKLLRKALKQYAGSPRSIDALSFKEVLRDALKHDLLDNAQQLNGGSRIGTIVTTPPMTTVFHSRETPFRCFRPS